MDQLVSSTPRLVACLHGGYPTKEKYVGSTVFVDQASDFSYIYHHTSLNSAQTVLAKQAFEAVAKGHGVTIKQVLIKGLYIDEGSRVDWDIYFHCFSSTFWDGNEVF